MSLCEMLTENTNLLTNQPIYELKYYFFFLPFYLLNLIVTLVQS